MRSGIITLVRRAADNSSAANRVESPKRFQFDFQFGEQRMTDLSKRNFLSRLLSSAIVMPLTTSAARALNLDAPQQQGLPPISPQHHDSGDVANTPPNADPKEMLKLHQKQIHDNVEKLYDLAGQLKEQVEKTETELVLSLPMVQKAEQIEKLAKQIKTMAREA